MDVSSKQILAEPHKRQHQTRVNINLKTTTSLQVHKLKICIDKKVNNTCLQKNQTRPPNINLLHYKFIKRDPSLNLFTCKSIFAMSKFSTRAMSKSSAFLQEWCYIARHPSRTTLAGQ